MFRTHYVALCTFLFLKKEKLGQWPIIPLLKIFLFSFDISKYRLLKFYASNIFCFLIPICLITMVINNATVSASLHFTATGT